MPLRINIRMRLWCGVATAACVLLFSGEGLFASTPQKGGTASANSVPAADLNDVASLSENLQRISSALDKKNPPQNLSELRDSLPGEWTVSTPEREYSISTQFLRSQLGDGTKEDAKTYLEQLRSELHSYSDPRPTGNANAKAELDRILSGPEFAAVHPPTAWDLFRQRLMRWIERLLLRFVGGMAKYPISGQILFWLVVVAAVGFIALWVFRFMVSRDRLDALPPGQPVVVVRTWQEWIRTAREAAARGDFREAVRAAYWAGIRRLQDAEALPNDPTKTPREYLRLVAEPMPSELAPRRRYSYRQPLIDLTTRFEKIWYADRGASSQDFAEALRQLEALGCQLE